MEDKVKFSENVILIDVAFLNEIVYSAKKVLSSKLGRELPDVDFPTWLSYLALDAGLREGDNEIQVLLVRDGGSGELNCCIPSDLDKLNGMACRTPLGEFMFASISAEGIVSCENLYLDLMNLALDSAEVNRLMLIPFHPLYAEKVEEALSKFFKGKSEEECKKAVYFALEKPLKPVFCSCDSIIYSIARAFGIKSDEL